MNYFPISIKWKFSDLGHFLTMSWAAMLRAYSWQFKFHNHWILSISQPPLLILDLSSHSLLMPRFLLNNSLIACWSSVVQTAPFPRGITLSFQHILNGNGRYPSRHGLKHTVESSLFPTSYKGLQPYLSSNGSKTWIFNITNLVLFCLFGSVGWGTHTTMLWNQYWLWDQ